MTLPFFEKRNKVSYSKMRDLTLESNPSIRNYIEQLEKMKVMEAYNIAKQLESLFELKVRQEHSYLEDFIHGIDLEKGNTRNI